MSRENRARLARLEATLLELEARIVALDRAIFDLRLALMQVPPASIPPPGEKIELPYRVTWRTVKTNWPAPIEYGRDSTP